MRAIAANSIPIKINVIFVVTKLSKVYNTYAKYFKTEVVFIL